MVAGAVGTFSRTGNSSVWGWKSRGMRALCWLYQGVWADAMTGPEYSRGLYSAQGGQATLTACQLLGSRESPQPGSRGLGVPGTPCVGAHPGDPSPHEAGFLY